MLNAYHKGRIFVLVYYIVVLLKDPCFGNPFTYELFKTHKTTGGWPWLLHSKLSLSLIGQQQKLISIWINLQLLLDSS